MILIAILIVSVVALVLFNYVRKAGYWDSVKVQVVEKTEELENPSQYLYKHCVGSYSKSSKYVSEIQSLLPPGAKVVVIYYDNPQEVADDLCQMAVGVSLKDSDLEPHFASQLSRWGYERMTLPAVNRAISVKQPYGGFASHLRLVNRTYPALLNFIKSNRLDCRLTVEVFVDDAVTVICPLDDASELIVPEVIPTEKLQLEQFYADDSDSEVDSEITDEEGLTEGETEGEVPELVQD